jgi:hypothetical protein
MSRPFEIIPTTAAVRREDGWSVSHDDRVMYLINEEAEAALDVILGPYGQFGGFYLDMMRVKYPGPWAFVVLRREYDIAKYVIAQRAKLDSGDTFSFTFFDNSVDFNAAGFVPKVGCLLFSLRLQHNPQQENFASLNPCQLFSKNCPPKSIG